MTDAAASFNYLTYDSTTGRILSTHSSNAPSDPITLAVGTASLDISDGITIGFNTHQVANPGTPNAAIVPFVATLAENQRTKTGTALDYFNGLFVAGFTWNGKLVQIDEASRNNISGGVNDALATLADPVSYPFQIPYWIAADNSHVPLAGPADMIAFGRAVLGYFQSCRAHLRATKDQIVAAPDQATLDAIDVTSGYPIASA